MVRGASGWITDEMGSGRCSLCVTGVVLSMTVSSLLVREGTGRGILVPAPRSEKVKVVCDLSLIHI